jgi:phosphate transport system substrate-binding protein
MSFNRNILLLLCLAFISGCKSGNSDQTKSKLTKASTREISGTFTISGAYALSPLVKKWAGDFMKINPAVKIVVTTGGTGQGIDDLTAGKIQLAMISRPLTDSELQEGIWSIPVAKDGVAAIVNQKNPYIGRILERGLSPDEFLKVFTGDIQLKWGELLDTNVKEKVSVFKRADESGAAEVFAGFLNRESSDLKGTGVVGDEEMIRSVQNNPLAIGFCNFSYAFDPLTGERIKDIQIVPADLDYDNKIETREIPFSNLDKAHRGLWLGLYPKNLCRELLIGSVGKPTDAVVLEFLKYILTDGQNNIKSAGLCELNDVYVGYSLEKLK